MVVQTADLFALKCWYSLLVQYHTKRLFYGVKCDDVQDEFRNVLALIAISECSTTDHCKPLDYISTYQSTELYQRVITDICVIPFTCSMVITQETIVDTTCPINNIKIEQL